ncbi:Cullin-associated NEDD8-dissociated protein 1 [Zopfochytrium polystomum]|nr:Cullin-associated NEDD8-dissociated protein 1 [Zopfochytrium polystomum]
MDSSYLVAGLLDKLTNADSDIRFMAMTDIASELTKDAFQMSDHVERKVVAAVLKALDDKNGEVQNLAVKTLVPLLRKAKEPQIREIVDHLATLLSQERDDLKDIASIGAKTVVLELPASTAVGKTMIKRMLPTLVGLLPRSDTAQLDIIDIVAESLSRFGKAVAEQPELASHVQAQLLLLMEHSRPAIRKRTIVAIGFLVVHTSDDLVLGKKMNSRDYGKMGTYIACFATLSRFSARRVGKYMGELTRLTFEYSKFDDDELRENCFQALESFVVRCPAEVTPHLNEIIALGLEYIKHDPNYDEGGDDGMDVDDGDDDGEEDMKNDEDEEEEEDEDDNYSDADDMSWKVRRAAAKLLSSVISTRSELVSELLANVAPALIARFKEREESVRVEVLSTFNALIRQVGAVSGVSITHSNDDWRSASQTSLDSDPRLLLQEQVPRLSKYLPKQMSGKSVSTRLAGFILLRELVSILQGGLGAKFGLLVPTIEASLVNAAPGSSAKIINDPNLKIEALMFLQVALSAHEPSTFEPYLTKLVGSAVAATKEKFYKITSEALLVLIELVKVIRPIPDDAVSVAPAKAGAPALIQGIYEVVLAEAKLNDVDLEVKDRSILALATILSSAGDLLQPSQITGEALPLLADRVRNEVTRLTALRAIKSVSDSLLVSSSTLDLGSVPADLVPIVGGFLRKSQRPLRMATLATLDSLIRRTQAVITTDMLDAVLGEVQTLNSSQDADVHIFPLSINVVSAALSVRSCLSHTVEAVQVQLMPTIVTLTLEAPHWIGSGLGLDALLQFWKDLVAVAPHLAAVGVDMLTRPLFTGSGHNVSKQAYRPLAESITTLAVGVPAQTAGIVQDFVNKVASGSDADLPLLNVSLLVVGTVGRHGNLLTNNPRLNEHLLSLFTAQQEEIKHAAAFALGNVAIGNLDSSLPAILSQVREGGKKRYLLLLALKEIIARSPTLPTAHAADLWQLLFANAQDPAMEENTRSVLAECLGKLLLADPPERIAALRVQLQSPVGAVRATVVSAVRHTLTDPTAGGSLDVALGGNGLSQFLLLGDPELAVRHMSLMTLTSAAHNKPHLIRGSLSELSPLLYQETAVKQELIHVVEMGPFKHRVDDGLEARKSAFECMYTLLSTCLSRIYLPDFVDRILVGLSDPAQDVKELNHLTLQRLAVLSPASLIARIDEAVAPLRESIDAKPKANAVRQEIERVQELVRSGVRTVVVLAKSLGIGAGEGTSIAPAFEELVRSLKVPGNPIYDTVVAVTNEVEAVETGGRR